LKLRAKRTKKRVLENTAKAADPPPSVSRLEEKPEAETSPKPKGAAPKIDLARIEGPQFEPHFDPYLDGDKGSLDWAIGFLMKKAVGSSADQAPPAETAPPEQSSEGEEEARERPAAVSAPQLQEAKVESEAASEVDLLRVRLWRARASHSRQAGLALVLLSAALFAGAFFTSALILEIGSVSSFMSGVALLAYEAEPRVKLFPSTSSLIGPLKVVESELKQHGLSKVEAVFERAPPDGTAGEVMTFAGGFGDEDAPRYSIPPLGEGLVHAYELELGDLAKLEVEGAKVWLPRVMVEGLGLADHVGMKSSGDEVTTVIDKPFIRALCVQDFMADGLCRVSGCPLTASVGQALARASGKPVTHRGCTYDPLTQKATLKDTLGQ
jgi:hypothetical protein